MRPGPDHEPRDLRPVLSQLLGHSPPIQGVINDIIKHARADTSLLLCGEEGTPKTIIARALHAAGPEPDSPLITLDCHTFATRDLIAPAQTPANHHAALAPPLRHLGTAEGGTLILENVHKLPDHMQTSLLKALRTRRLPGMAPRQTFTVRLIATAGSHLNQLMRLGLFNPDLHALLAKHTLTIPPLRGRPEDIIAIADRFLNEANIELRKSVRTFSPETRSVLLEHSWPGNYSELWNVIFRATFDADDAIGPARLRAALTTSHPAADSHAQNLVHKIMRAQTLAFLRIKTEPAPTPGQTDTSIAGRILGIRQSPSPEPQNHTTAGN